jgi:SAM-dependent methyltransferase
MDQEREANLANWESRVAIHVASQEYDVDALVAGTRRLSDVVAFDAPFLGDLTGLDAVHLQCHIGTDTLSLARLGARVAGLDFSPSAIEAAREIAQRAGIDATFVQSEFYGAVDELGAEHFDLVYTGVGAIGWLPDIAGWARVAAALLRPGGRLYIREGHPMMWTLDDDMQIGFPYFERAGAVRMECDTTYADSEARISAPVTYEFNHGLGEIVQAVLDAGMTLTRLAEHDFCEWQGLPPMVREADGKWRMPADIRDRLPLMYTLEAYRTD